MTDARKYSDTSMYWYWCPRDDGKYCTRTNTTGCSHFPRHFRSRSSRAGDDGADRVAVEHFGIRGYGAVRPGNGNDVVEDRKRTRLIAVRRPADLLERIPAEPDVPLDRADDQRLEQRIARRCFTPSRAMQPTPESGRGKRKP